MRFAIRVCVFVFSVVFFTGQHGYAGTARDAVVKIFVTTNPMDYTKPWQSIGIQSITGSGCIISGHRILTNAHVVSDHTFIQVRKESDSKKYTAKVTAVGQDCDLAILTVEDENFFKDTEPLLFGELPQLQDAVTVIGYPIGGDKVSITEGVVSRVEIIPYIQSNKKLLAIQIDAAINPGNSGGPVVKDGKLVGIAMQLIFASQNIGYMIPIPIINHFLDDLADKTYDGFPTLGIEYHNTENSALREYYKADATSGGVIIAAILPFSPAVKVLKEGDILLKINDIPIDMDGTFHFRDDERLELSYLINEQQINDTIELQIFRHGKLKTENVKLTSFQELIPSPHYFEKPPYYIYGGLVFTSLSIDLLQAWGKDWWHQAPIDFLYYLIGSGRLNKTDKNEVVVLLNVLPDDINIGYHNYQYEVMTKVNGHDFSSFREFVVLLENNKEAYTKLETEQNIEIVLKNDNILACTKDILERNNIPSQYSKDVRLWLNQE